MNKEIIKAMQGKKEHKMRKWWRQNGYKVWRVVLFPLWIGELLKNKIDKRLNSKEEWNEERANEILSYYIPRRAEWDEKEQCFYLFDNGMGWGIAYAKKFLKRKDRRFWQVNGSWWGGQMRIFLIEKFELEGFTKEVGVCDDGWTEVTFNLNKKGA
jgi:hypothetical protein